MTPLLISWRAIEAPITTTWRGPEGVIELIEASPALPVFAGWVVPAGYDPNANLDGDRGDITIQGGQWLIDDIDLGTFN